MANLRDAALEYHRMGGKPGKISVTPTKPLDTQWDLSLAYSPGVAEPVYSDIVEVNLDQVEPCVAGPSRPEQRTPLSQVPASFQQALERIVAV